MKEYRVSYMIGSMYHAYIVDAESWGHAVKQVVNGIQEGSLAKPLSTAPNGATLHFISTLCGGTGSRRRCSDAVISGE